MAAIMCAGPGSAVVYGVPGVGATTIVVNEVARGDAASRLLELSPTGECFNWLPAGASGPGAGNSERGG